jgi:hypothetical protein
LLRELTKLKPLNFIHPETKSTVCSFIDKEAIQRAAIPAQKIAQEAATHFACNLHIKAARLPPVNSDQSAYYYATPIQLAEYHPAGHDLQRGFEHCPLS